MNITGARWGLNDAQAVLTLRALVSNGDFNAYWSYHLDQEGYSGRAYGFVSLQVRAAFLKIILPPEYPSMVRFLKEWFLILNSQKRNVEHPGDTRGRAH